jgi:hypothetical protein
VLESLKLEQKVPEAPLGFSCCHGRPFVDQFSGLRAPVLLRLLTILILGYHIATPKARYMYMWNLGTQFWFEALAANLSFGAGKRLLRKSGCSMIFKVPARKPGCSHNRKNTGCSHNRKSTPGIRIPGCTFGDGGTRRGHSVVFLGKPGLPTPLPWKMTM